MLRCLQTFCVIPQKCPLLLGVRHLTQSEVAAALRPFYFSVHPDLFGQYPSERALNEQSLQQLSSVLNNLQSSRPIAPVILKFYIKNKDKDEEKVTFQLVKVPLNGRDVRTAVLTILKSCKLSTEYVDKIAVSQPTYFHDRVHIHVDDFSKMNRNHPIFEQAAVQREIRETKALERLDKWLEKHHENALNQARKNDVFQVEIDKLCNDLITSLGLKEIQWKCGWNDSHYRGCLLSFRALLEQHPSCMADLKGRTLVFSNFTGVSLEGDIMLYTGEVRSNWLDLIKNIKKFDASLVRIPQFEKALSHVLRDIKVVRRKFMPKIVAEDYEKNLNRITTALSDYRSKNDYPKTWPSSLSSHEIVVETEAGPLMVSPTGQFIVPCGLPGGLLVNFITTNLSEAQDKMTTYKRDKYVERDLDKKVMEELGLKSLIKDDSVTPSLMIKCCENLLKNKLVLKPFLTNIQLNVTTFYSVLSNGVVCIPWNWHL